MESEMTLNYKRLKRVIEMVKTLNDKTILQMLEDEKTLPENKGIYMDRLYIQRIASIFFC